MRALHPSLMSNPHGQCTAAVRLPTTGSQQGTAALPAAAHSRCHCRWHTRLCSTSHPSACTSLGRWSGCRCPVRLPRSEVGCTDDHASRQLASRRSRLSYLHSLWLHQQLPRPAPVSTPSSATRLSCLPAPSAPLTNVHSRGPVVAEAGQVACAGDGCHGNYIVAGVGGRVGSSHIDVVSNACRQRGDGRAGQVAMAQR